MPEAKVVSQLRLELLHAKKEVKTLQTQKSEYAIIKSRLEEALENLTVHQEELRAQNEQLRHMQDELERSHHKYFDLFEGAPLGYFTLNWQGIILEANITGAEMLGFDRQLLVQTRMSRYIKPWCQTNFTIHCKKVFSGVFSESAELEFELPGKKPFHVLLESVPIFKQGNRVSECRTAMIDITDRKRLEEQLHHAQKLESLGVLAAGIAHDFNNLLTTISSHAGLLRRALQSEDVEKIHLEKIEKAVVRGGELANQMMAYSGRTLIINNPFDLAQLVEDMKPLSQVACAKNVVLSFAHTQDPPMIQGDPSQIRQVVLNLITNASESISDKTGRIHVTTGNVKVNRAYRAEHRFIADLPDGNAVYLEVTDSGAGIEQDMITKIFDPFFTTKFQGRGMGLAAIIGIVRAHGGGIHVSSLIGIGTTFRILFPIHQTDAIETTTNDSEVKDTWRGHGLFLVIDDEEDICIAAECLLRELGFDVLLARDGREGLRLIQEHTTALSGVLLDLTMPYISGEEVYEEIRNIAPTVPVILSSGYTEDDVLLRFSEQPVSGFIQKPYLLETLIEKIQDVFGSK